MGWVVMDEQAMHQDVKNHIMSHIKDIEKIDNNLRRGYVKRFNEIIMMLAYTLQKHNEVSKSALGKHIMKTYVLSDVAINRYFKQIVASDVFDYDETLEVFRLPENLRKQLAQTHSKE